LEVCLQIFDGDLVEAEKKHLLAESDWKREQAKHIAMRILIVTQSKLQK
jgi:hypothetical protein